MAFNDLYSLECYLINLVCGYLVLVYRKFGMCCSELWCAGIWHLLCGHLVNEYLGFGVGMWCGYLIFGVWVFGISCASIVHVYLVFGVWVFGIWYLVMVEGGGGGVTQSFNDFMLFFTDLRTLELRSPPIIPQSHCELKHKTIAFRVRPPKTCCPKLT